MPRADADRSHPEELRARAVLRLLTPPAARTSYP